MPARPRALVTLGVVVTLVLLGSGCGWLKRGMYEGFRRDRWQKPDEVVRALAIEPGSRVADVGAGGGYFTFRLAEAVGPAGRVYAVDVDPDMTAFLAERAADEGARNVDVVLASPDDARLPPGGVALVFMCNTYHHLADPAAYFGSLRASLAPGGRVAIVDYLPRGFFQWLFPHSAERDAIEAAMHAAGYRLVQAHDFLPKQSFLVFEVREG